VTPSMDAMNSYIESYKLSKRIVGLGERARETGRAPPATAGGSDPDKGSTRYPRWF